LELRCTQTYGAHWGIFYQEGRVYQVIDETTYEITLIINEKEYWDKTRLVADFKKYEHYLKSGEYTHETLHEVIPGYESLRTIKEKYTIRVNLPYYTIGGEGREKHSFISISKNEIIQKFGSCEFNTTELLAEDYFDMIPIYREQKLNQLL
jgi:hypothetical protein